MKKTYINPSIVVVQLHAMRMLAESVGLYNDVEVTNNSEFLTKEVVSDVNVWDDEW